MLCGGEEINEFPFQKPPEFEEVLSTKCPASFIRSASTSWNETLVVVIVDPSQNASSEPFDPNINPELLITKAISGRVEKVPCDN